MIAKLEEAVVSANTGLDAIKRAPIVDEDTGIKCLRIQDISQTKEYKEWGFTKVDSRNFEKFQLKPDDLIIARTGGSIGVNKLISKELQSVFNNGLIRIRIDKENYDPSFIYYVLQSEKYWGHINAIAFSTSTQPNMKIKDFLRFEFSKHPLPEQKAIAHILGTLDDKIELNRQMNQTLEAMAQTLFKSWFVDFDPVIDNALAAGNQIPAALQARAEKRKALLDRHSEGGTTEESPQYGAPLFYSNPALAALFPSSFEYNETLDKWIPEGWEETTFGEEFSVTMGQSPPGSSYNEEGIGKPFFQGKTDFGFRFPTNRMYCTEPKREAAKNDTLISVRAPVGNANLASSDCIIGRGLCAVRHKSQSISYTYYSSLQLKEVFDVFEGEGTVFGSINQTGLKSIQMAKPADEIITAFDKLASKMDMKIEMNSEEINTLTQLRDTLLPQLISGKVRVPEEVIEEMN